MSDCDTIVALATAPGRGGVGIVRLSGPQALEIAQQLTRQSTLSVAQATHVQVFDEEGLVDSGLALFFESPHSYTGEDVVELQLHGSPPLLQHVIDLTLTAGARMAEPGEYSMRRFLNNKSDLIEAEALCDLISSQSLAQARAATRSLQGAFSEHIHQLLSELIELRKYVEAAIDFSDEDIEFLPLDKIRSGHANLLAGLDKLIHKTQQGIAMRDGVRVAIIGPSNAGKSTLRNFLAGDDAAIVTDVPGTTRDAISTQINVSGMPVCLVDTAGFRATDDVVEKIGIERAKQASLEADMVVWVQDASTNAPSDWAKLWADHCPISPEDINHLLVFNKADLCKDGEKPTPNTPNAFYVSVKDGTGMADFHGALSSRLQNNVGGDGTITARRRHLSALTGMSQALMDAGAQLSQTSPDWTLLAECLRISQQALSTITGQFSSDDLLGEIFSSFCIGK